MWVVQEIQTLHKEELAFLVEFNKTSADQFWSRIWFSSTFYNSGNVDIQSVMENRNYKAIQCQKRFMIFILS